MGTIHLFNPENDLALAFGKKHFTAPAAAMALHRAGALLPMWWAESNDLILATNDQADDVEFLKSRFGLNGQIATSQNIRSVTKASPWGWSEDAVTQLRAIGTPGEILPDKDSINIIRNLSHRRLTREVLKRMNVPERLLPIEFTDPQKAIAHIASNPNSFMKLPWSSSGRGILQCNKMPRKQIENYASGIIRRQGSLMIEPEYDKQKDFAALFACNRDRLQFKALSAFATNDHNAYDGNIIMSDNRIIDWLGTDPMPWIERLQNALEPLLLNKYEGWLGIDMLTYTFPSDGKLQIAPCIEINLRTTMGVVSYHLRQKLALSNRPAIFRIGRTAPPIESTLILPPRDGFFFSIQPIA